MIFSLFSLHSTCVL